MFCPRCKAEYLVGFVRCSDCDVELVDHLPAEKPGTAPKPSRDFEGDRFEPEAELVVIRTYQSGLEADLAKTVLEAAGIESMIKGDDIARRYSGLSFTQGVELLVRAEDAGDAEKILDIDATGGDDPTKTGFSQDR